MKKIATLIIFALATITLSAKEIKNPQTNMVMSDHLGIYTITGSHGAIVTGNEKQTKDFLLSCTEAFADEITNKTFSVGKDRFEVGKDDAGLYIMKVGLGGVKLRISDVVIFGSALGIKTAKETIKEGWNYLKEKKAKYDSAIKG